MCRNELENKLESLIDANCLEDVLGVLGEICRDKCSHIEGNWQDHALAKAWLNAAKHIDKTTSGRS
jgi:hypothetical protein